ncbi:cation:dicarboxylase symporter family transporter [Sphingomonas sp. KR1UV-12]|uniref:Cation:dicarboxylase symporter family transporter n=1 Tax=Sphingomonas aurea TaxID=3063994 RepID=A0ABT9END4_9SPHN|nr:cation:dicarboxylase symporter family transporter [Sphingomonas sp. KR1UV-12]MDP1028472.1 cation:dicarboxylase symporter family transporter [Sphingomonas sp. KR1UV-12]
MIQRGRAVLRRMPAPGWMMVALVAGFAAGASFGTIPAARIVAELIGGIWLDALRMTIVPLVFALIVTGVAGLRLGSRGEAMHLGRRLPVVLLALLAMSAIVAALLSPVLIGLFTIPQDSIAALRSAIPAAPPPVVPGTVEAVRALIPTNPVASAATGAIVPLVVFALVLGLAIGRVEAERARALLQPLHGLADAMVVVVGWVLRIAAIGIGALAFTVGATAGITVVAMLGQYLAASLALSAIIIVIGYVTARVAGGIPVRRFTRAAGPAQAVAAGTQSSLATLPAMMLSAQAMGIDERDASVALPIAVAVFKITAPSNTLLVALTVAWMGGVAVSPVQIMLAIPLAILSSLMILSLPGAISIYAGTAPTIIALGAPIELLPILVAVDVIPDMLRTVANVTYDLVATAIIARR